MPDIGFYDIPVSLESEINELESLIEQHIEGSVSTGVLKVHRVPFGVYEQRKDNTFMMRIRCTGGGITPKKLAVIAGLAENYGRDSIHLTTRQEIQLHNIALEHVIPIMRELVKVGLSTRGGGGNTVRNIMASWDSGIAPGEVFDVTPYAIALSSRMIAEPDSWILPRKYKFSFSNSPDDNANAVFNDVGFVAHIKDNQKGFKVFVAGGMGAKSETGKLLYDFVAADQVYIIAKGIKQLFSKFGNRKNKHRARLRFLWNKLGREKFIELFDSEIKQLRDLSVKPLEIMEMENRPLSEIPIDPVKVESAGFDLWRKRYVKEQKQTGLYSVLFPIFLGDLAVDETKTLADFLGNFGENVIRCTMQQNFSIRNIPFEYLGNVYQTVTEISERPKNPVFITRAVACTGADTCKLGICLPHGAVKAIDKKLRNSGIDLDMVQDVRLHISGCPNSCGQHLAADLGFFGKVVRKGQTMYPAYNIVAGAVTGVDNYRFARKIGEISARDLPEFVVDLFRSYTLKKDNHRSFSKYIYKSGEADIRSICDTYRDVPDFEDDKNYYFDWGDEKQFSLVGKGVGECSAGLFDLIDLDKNRIHEIRNVLDQLTDIETLSDTLYNLILLSARMLLITRGVEATSDEMVFDSFNEHFIKYSLVDERFTELIDLAKRKQLRALPEVKELIFDLADAVEQLYEKMDDSLTFTSQAEIIEDANKSSNVNGNEEPSLFKDYRGVPCPLNFVKVKIDLSAMSEGETLKVLLDDDDSIENVPRSVVDEGHEIVTQDKIENYWSVIIRKKG